MRILLTVILIWMTILVQAQTKSDSTITIDNPFQTVNLYSSSIKNNQPLFILNMGEFSKDSMNLTLSKEVRQDSLNSIKPESIESIDILRGKSATDLYGEKGKNGVVIITLKSNRKVKD